MGGHGDGSSADNSGFRPFWSGVRTKFESAFFSHPPMSGFRRQSPTTSQRGSRVTCFSAHPLIPRPRVFSLRQQGSESSTMDRLESLGNSLSQITLYDIKSMYNQVRKASGSIMPFLMTTQAKNVVFNVSEMEAKVQEATNDEPW